MKIKDKLNIESLLTIDETGMPKPPTLRQLLDKDVRELYTRDKTSDKSNYIKEAGVIYYLGDPKSPPKQCGKSNSECIQDAIKNFDLPKNYTPDILVLKLAKRYYDDNITEAGTAVEIMQQAIHNSAVAVKVLNETLNNKLQSISTPEDVTSICNLMDAVNKKASDLPNLIKKLNEAYENLLYEKQTQTSRGGNSVSSSMDAEGYN